MTRQSWTDEEDARLAALRGEGLSDADIGTALGRIANAVSNRICLLKARGKGADIPSRKRRSQWTPGRVAEARGLRAEGLTVSQVAARVGSNAATVSRALRSPEVAEDSPGQGVRVARTVPDLDRAAREVEQARAALARAEARHREALDGVLVPLRESMRAVGLVPSTEGEGDLALLLVERLRGRGLEFRRVA